MSNSMAICLCICRDIKLLSVQATHPLTSLPFWKYTFTGCHFKEPRASVKHLMGPTVLVEPYSEIKSPISDLANTCCWLPHAEVLPDTQEAHTVDLKKNGSLK